MPKPSYAAALFERWFTIILLAILGAVLAVGASFLQPLKYASTAKLLILQETGPNVDAYAAARSEELIADKLSTIVYTTTFLNQVFEAGYNVDASQFPQEDRKRRKEWGKTIGASVSRGSGLLNVTAYHEDREQAEEIARAVSQVLIERAGEYTSSSNVQIRLIDEPLNSRWPVKPNIPLNAFTGLLLGGLVGVGYVLLKEGAESVKKRK